MPVDESGLFQARMILYPELQREATFLQKTFSVIRSFGRKNLLERIRHAEQTLFLQPEHRAFQNEIEDIFLKR
jgi:hypothetical protein